MRRFLISISAVLVTLNMYAQVTRYSVEVVNSYPHDFHAYTQGLFWHDGILYESTGLYGKSSLRIVDLESGELSVNMPFNKKYFVEGSTILDGNLYVLTWQSRVLFVYDAETLQYRQAYSYPRDGWGLTTDGVNLIASDGSSKLYVLSPELQLLKTLNVTIGGRALNMLNELEWIDGRIWANVYTTDMIVIINPDSGVVEGIVDCSGLLPDKLRTEDTDVLNGIAVDGQGRIFLTGKNWPRLYEVKLVEEK